MRIFRMGYKHLDKPNHTYERFIDELLASDYCDIDKKFRNTTKVVNPMGLRRYEGTGIIKEDNIYDIFGILSYNEINGKYPN